MGVMLVMVCGWGGDDVTSNVSLMLSTAIAISRTLWMPDAILSFLFFLFSSQTLLAREPIT
jgi:hypothetical protein